MLEFLLALLIIVLFVLYSFAGYSLFALIVAWDKLSTVSFQMAGFWLIIAILGTAVFLKLYNKSVEQKKQEKLKGKNEVGIIGSIAKILTIPAVLIAIAGLYYSYTPEHYVFLFGLFLLGFAFLMYYIDLRYPRKKKKELVCS